MNEVKVVSIKSKLVKYTVAASVVATSFAGIPLSDKGLFEKFGSPSAYASTSGFLNNDAVELTNKLHAALVSTGGEAALKAAQDKLAGLSIGKKRAIVAPISSKIAAKIDLTSTQEDVLEALLADLAALQYDSTGSNLEAIRTNDDYRSVLFVIAASAGVPTATSLEDIVGSVSDYNDTIKNKILNMSATDLLALGTSVAKQNEFLEAIVTEVLGKAPVSTFATYYGINSDDINQVRKNVRDAIGTTEYNNAVKALGKAYVAAFATTSSGGGGGYVGGVISSNFGSQLDELKSKLAGATDAERAELAKKAVELAIAELAKLNSFDASKYVKSVDGKTTVELGSELLDALEKSKAIFDKLNEFLAAAKTDVKAPAVNFSLNLGDVKDSIVQTKVSEAAMKAWFASGYSGFSIVINGLEVTFPAAAEYAAELDLTVNVSDVAGVKALEGYKALSSVYDFDLKLGGKAVSSFSHPVKVAFPLNNLSGVDKELVSVAKLLLNGNLEFNGGRLVGDKIHENRANFSSYVALENKVKFSDTTSVQGWAGRQIEVLAAKGAIEGRGAGKFDPKGNVTRAEFAKMLIRAFDLESEGNEVTFKDVDAKAWYAPYVASAAKLGIINGRTTTTFAPNATITRAEMATMIARAVQSVQGTGKVADEDAALKAFSDADKINATLKAGVAFAADNGLIIGNNGKFLPQNNASRAEAAVIMYRAINLK